jgi:fructokinase
MTVSSLTVVSGEALFDLVVDDAGTLTPHPGGGPFNTARTIGRLGQPVAFLGRLSSDWFGTQLAQLLERDGVSLDAIVPTEDPTTLAIAELDGDGSARYRFYERGTAAVGLTPDSAVAALPEGVGYLHVGTLGLVLEPMAAALEALVERLAGEALIAIDPNCRPWVIRDEAAYRSRLGRVLAHGDLVKLSEEDLAWLDPDRPPVDALRALLAQGPRLALLTRGARGALVITADEEVDVPAPAVEVVDTIGAGDAFGGGFLAWWQERGLGREDLTDLSAAVEATRFACMVAARTCANPGASPPRLAELAV